ncbi:MAG: Ig-like domain-containing protein [Gemmatimonadaceae bacterium]
MRAITASLVLFLAACTDATSPTHPRERPSLGINAAGTTRVTVDPGFTAMHAGDTLRVHATVVDGTGAPLTSQSVTWITNNSSVATVTTLGTVRAVAVGTAMIFARRNGAEDTTVVNVYLAGVGIRPLPGYVTRVGAGRNEPLGFIAISDRPFKSRAISRTDDAAAEWWNANAEWNAAQLSIVSDVTAPISPSSVAQIRYPAGMQDGIGPAGMSLRLPNNRAISMATAVRISANFYGHPSGVNKLNYFYMAAGKPKIYFSAQGQGMGALQPQIRLQGIAEQPVSRNLPLNLMPGATITRGVWHRIEFLLVANTPGQPNGEAHMWLNGTKILDSRTITYLAPGEKPFDTVSITSIWGGASTANVPYDMYAWWDHAYVSAP